MCFYSEKAFFLLTTKKRGEKLFFFFSVAETVSESILADTCYPQVVYYDGADL